MLVYGVLWGELVPLAAEVGVHMVDLKAKGTAWQFSLKPSGEKFWRINARGSRMPKACWHGHVAFFRALFAVYPAARVVTRMATYEGAGEFVRLHEETFRLVNHTGEACQCEKETGHGTVGT